MELLRVNPKRVVEIQIDGEDSTDFSDDMPRNLECLKMYTNMALMRDGTLDYNKILLQEYIEESVERNESEFLIRELESHLDNTIGKVLSKISVSSLCNSSSLDGNASLYYNLFNDVELCWCHVRLAMSDLMQICSPLENALKKSQSGYGILWEKVIESFKKDKLLRAELYEKLILATLDRIRFYRMGHTINFCQLRNIVQMFSFIELYEPFEVRMINETRKCYKKLSQEILSENLIPHCYLILRSKIDFEVACSLKYLGSFSVEKVIKAVTEETLYSNSSLLLDKEEIKKMISSGDTQSICSLRSLCFKTDLEEVLYDVLMAAAKEICDGIIRSFLSRRIGGPADHEQDYNIEVITQLFEFQKTMDLTILPVLASPKDYKDRLKNLWTTALNDEVNHAEFITLALAKYSDDACVKSSPEYFNGAEDCEVNFILHLFRFLGNKSYFEHCYRNFLAMRLMYDQNINENHILMVLKLKEECGATYVSKLESLIADVESSRGINAEFTRLYLENAEWNRQLSSNIASDKDGFDFTTLVISTDTWLGKATLERPLAPVDDSFIDCDVEGSAYIMHESYLEIDNSNLGVSIEDIGQIQTQFREFYSSKYKNKSIRYLPEFGSATIVSSFPKFDDKEPTTYEFKLSICQAYCLISLNKLGSINLIYLENLLGEEYNEIIMRNHLKILSVFASVPLVIFQNEGLNFENCSKRDHFVLNTTFYSPKQFLDFHRKTQESFSKEMALFNKHTTFEDTTPFVESAIVHYLKQTIEAPSTTIFKMCCNNTRYALSSEEFNKVIEALCEREFIQIDQQNREIIRYIP